MSKHFKFRSIMSIIYGLIMLLPVTSVAFRCAYTIFNKNAFESYYGETINQRIDTFIQSSDLQINTNYYYVANIQFQNNYSYSSYVAITNLQIDNNNYSRIGNPQYSVEECNRIYLYIQNNSYQYFFTKNNADLNNSYRGQAYNNPFSFTYNFKGYSNPNDTNLLYYFNNNYFVSYNNYSYLDNAFEYSLFEFVGQNGRGVLNLTDWFTSVFLQNSTHTQLYLDFINWYMNYTLLVSCVYILYLVLMWFVSLARRLLTNMIEKGGELK